MDTISTAISSPMMNTNTNNNNNNNNGAQTDSQSLTDVNNQLQSSHLKSQLVTQTFLGPNLSHRVTDNNKDNSNHTVNQLCQWNRMSNLNNGQEHLDPDGLDSIIRCLLVDIINKVHQQQDNQQQLICNDAASISSENSSPGDNSCDLVIDSSSLYNESPPSPPIDGNDELQDLAEKRPQNAQDQLTEKQSIVLSQRTEVLSNPDSIEIPQNDSNQPKPIDATDPESSHKPSNLIQRLDSGDSIQEQPDVPPAGVKLVPKPDDVDDNADGEEKVFITLEPVDVKKSTQEEEVKEESDMCIAQDEQDVKDVNENEPNQEETLKRKLETASEPELEQEDTFGSGSSRTKRRRTRTQLFQAGDSKEQHQDSDQTEFYSPVKERKSSRSNEGHSRKSKSSDQINTSLTDSQTSITESDKSDVIFYARNSYLAIRNEDNSFYLCQLMENVRKLGDYIKIKWLDTDNDGQTYYLTHQTDRIPLKSILMQVVLQNKEVPKKSKKMFVLSDLERGNIMSNLEMSLTVQPGVTSSQESSATSTA